ncbi:MAG: tRNA (N6-threonylcarbamoyladenosine(37)-N6)-methyltransferase TrmO [Bacteroidales bacterium]|nr:tRNA (N6-threonylcarbamoyladenosine(37)-N6)-methyltransferase TrmO [Bacteroidales bacterium]
MEESTLPLQPVAFYKGSFGSKFGIPRQGGLAPSLQGRIVFTEAYRVREALRGLDGFSRLWLIWGFSANRPTAGKWQPTVRPPRLGGNTALGVWATRSPFRPNPLGLSCVELVAIDGMELVVRGADLMDGTPIYDIKPYVAYADSFPDARCGFASEAPRPRLEVVIPPEIPLDARQREVLAETLSYDPRPAYQDCPEKDYALAFEGGDVHFSIRDNVLTIKRFER